MNLASPQPRKRTEFASLPHGKGMMFRNMGIGEQGAKARNLINIPPLLHKSLTVAVAPSDRYPISHFKEFCEFNGLSLDPLHSESVANRYLLETETITLPPRTKRMARRTVERFSDLDLIMVREAEADLRHGEGAFKTVPCSLNWATFEDKCEALEKAIMEVYMSWFSVDGAAHRKKHGSRGMGVMIEAIVGEKIEVDGKPYLLPHFSGVGYSNYMGQGMLGRVVKGLGTFAVDGGGGLFTEKGFVNTLRDLEQETADAISIITGKIVKIPCSKLPFDSMDLAKIIVVLEELKERGNYYIEWSYLPGKMGQASIFINQICEIKEGNKNIIAPREGEWQLLATGSDCVGEGGKECFGVVSVSHYWNPEMKKIVDYISNLLTNYLLIVPKAALSDAAGENKLTKASIINCSAVQENASPLSESIKINLTALGQTIAEVHSISAATHFAGICQAENIHFLSAPTDVGQLFSSGGQMILRPTQNYGCVYIFNAMARMEQVPLTKAMNLYLNTDKMPIDALTWNFLIQRLKGYNPEDKSERQPEKLASFTFQQLDQIATNIRDLAHQNEKTNGDVAEILYKVSNAILDIIDGQHPDIYQLPKQGERDFTQEDIRGAQILVKMDAACRASGADEYLGVVLEKLER